MLCIGFRLMRTDYSLILGVVISVMDALPVIGAGLIMFPMMIYYIIIGEYMLAVATLALYFIVMIVKRILEPRLLGSQMKLNQLATMVAMYAGYVVMGYIGLLIGPLMLKLFIAVINSSNGAMAAPQPAAESAIVEAPAVTKVGKRHGRKK